MPKLRLGTGGSTAGPCWRNTEACKRAARAEYILRPCEHARCIAKFGRTDGRASGEAGELTDERASIFKCLLHHARRKARSYLKRSKSTMEAPPLSENAYTSCSSNAFTPPLGRMCIGAAVRMCSRMSRIKEVSGAMPFWFAPCTMRPIASVL